MRVILNETQIEKVKRLINNFLEDYQQQGVKKIEVDENLSGEQVSLTIFVCMSFLEDKPKPGFLLIGMKNHLKEYIHDFLNIYVSVKAELLTC